MYSFRKIAGATALAVCIMSIMGCKKDSKDAGYIGRSGIQVTDGKMTPEVMTSLGRLSDPQLSPDGQFILYGVSYTSIEENRSCRNLLVCNADGSNPRGLTHFGKSVSNARWMPDGKTIAFIQGGQIWTGEIARLNTDKSLKLKHLKQASDIKSGVSEFKFSPDFKKLLYSSTVPGKVQTPSQVDPKFDKAQAYITEDLAYRHWDHWVTEIPHTYVAAWGSKITKETSKDILGGDEVKFELPTEPWSGMEQLTFSPDGQWVAYSCKRLTGKRYAFSTNTEIYLYHTTSGMTYRLTNGGGYDTNPVWSPDGSKLAWLSMARDGYEADKTRLMVWDVNLPDMSGFVPSTAPAEDWEDREIPMVCENPHITDLTADFIYNADSPVWGKDSKHLYFNALCEGIQGMFRVAADGVQAEATAYKAPAVQNNVACALRDARPGIGSKVERLTSDDMLYDFSSPFAIIENDEAITLLTTYNSLDFPTEMVSVSLDKNNGNAVSLKQISFENEAILSQLDKPEAKAYYLKTVDGQDMLTWVLYPPKFDSSKVYPAIEILLGGPQGTLSQGWSYRWNYRLMAAQGYVVVMPNRRGTTAFGPEWTEEISGDYIGLNMQDYLTAGKWIKSQPYIGKVAATGASYGGYSVYYMAGIHEDTYDCFIAHAGIFDEKYMYYETEEMWFPNWDNGGLSEYAFEPGQMGPKGDGKTFGGMLQAGSPWSDAPKSVRHYSNSPADNVTKWHTPILCIHGCLDFRIPYDQGMAAFNAAQMMGVPSKLVIFPEENHWITQPQNSLLWHREYFDWLDRWCK